jgi:Flp pilus assembly protein TadD
MSALSALQLASDEIEDARKRLERAKADADDDYEIRQALKHIDEASSYIKKAMSEIRQQQG